METCYYNRKNLSDTRFSFHFFFLSFLGCPDLHNYHSSYHYWCFNLLEVVLLVIYIRSDSDWSNIWSKMFEIVSISPKKISAMNFLYFYSKWFILLPLDLFKCFFIMKRYIFLNRYIENEYILNSFEKHLWVTIWNNILD